MKLKLAKFCFPPPHLPSLPLCPGLRHHHEPISWQSKELLRNSYLLTTVLQQPLNRTGPGGTFHLLWGKSTGVKSLKDRTHRGFMAVTGSASVMASQGTESVFFHSLDLTGWTLHHLHLLSLPGISKGKTCSLHTEWWAHFLRENANHVPQEAASSATSSLAESQCHCWPLHLVPTACV